LQASQVYQSANPCDQERNCRQRKQNHAGNEKWQITEICYLCISRVSIRASSVGTSNKTSDEQAQTNKIHKYTDNEEDSDGSFSHGMPPIKEIVLVIVTICEMIFIFQYGIIRHFYDRIPV
jgi:hypothetical protein